MTSQEWLNSEDSVKRSKKSYTHFDLRTDISKKRNYISDPHKVATHGFYPFIHYQIKMVKFNKIKGKKVKVRDVCYASHIDRCIYQYYSFILNELYNERIRIDGISDVAVAYRTDLHKNNIHFSKRAFDFIKKLEKCYVMIGDFTQFFDNLDHSYLKQQWCSLLKSNCLPDDHYNVFKSITAYSKWELEDLLALNGLGDNWSDRKKFNSQIRAITQKQYKDNRSHIVKNLSNYGIPQGSPISAVLANVYMLDVDKLISDVVMSYGGMYMRYSDDFIIIIPDIVKLNASDVFKQIHIFLGMAPRLTLEPSKTQYFHYSACELENCGKYFHSQADSSSKCINFLGFSFDGKKVFIRAKTISKYYYRMYRKAKNIVKAGEHKPNGTHRSCENLYRRYSERGADGKPGNFLTYVSHAEKEYGIDEAITRDTKRHMQKIRKALDDKKGLS